MNGSRSKNPPESQSFSDGMKTLQKSMLRFLSPAGCLAGLALVLLSLLPQPNTLDMLLLITGVVTIFVSLFAWIRSRVFPGLSAHVYVVMLFALVQVLFIRYGWSGQSLITWLALCLVTSALLPRTSSRILLTFGFASLMIWFMLASTNRIHQVIVITQDSLVLDGVIILMASAVGILLISYLKQANFRCIQELENTRALSFQAVDTAQSQVKEMESQLEQKMITGAISQSLNGVLEPSSLIQQAAEKIKAAFDLYYVGVFLIDPAHEYAVLKYGTGEQGRRMVANRHRLAVGGYSMIGWTTQTHKSRIALDVGEEAVHFDNPELPETRSELSLPLQTENGIIGALSIQSAIPNAFSPMQIESLQNVVDSMALALEKANAFDQTRKTLDELRELNRSFVQQSWGEILASSGNLKVDYENSKAVSAAGQSSTVKVPLILRNEVIGFFNLEVEGSELQADQMEFLQAISSQTTTALENARLIEETQRAAAQEQKLNQLSTQFSRAQTIDEILRTAVTEFGNLPSVSEAAITLVSPDDLEDVVPDESEPEVNQ